MRDDEYSAIKDRAARMLFQIPGVNAVGIGGRVVAGKPTGQGAIKVFVTVKRPASEVAPAELIPSSFEGVAIDVVEGGPFRRAAGPPKETPRLVPDVDVSTPLRGGISLATEGTDGLGTLGCFVLDKNDATAIYALTNYHVVAKEGKLSRSRRVLHPGNVDPSQIPTDTDLDTHTIGIVAAGGHEAIRDAALVRLKPGLTWIPTVKDFVGGFVTGTYDATKADADNLTQVWKRGAASGLIVGQIESVDTLGLEIFDDSTQTSYDTKGNIVVKKGTSGLNFAQQGDSGSVVMTNDGKVVGLLHAQDGKGGAFVTPIATVLRRFKEVDHLDLQIAVPTTAAPTDASETRTVLPPGGKAYISGADQIARGDHQYYRPLMGGAPILVSPMLGVAQAATMGCVLTAGNTGPAYLLTAYNALSAGDTIPPTPATAIGQPDNTGHCCHCTNNTVGHFFAGPDSQKRAGFVALAADQNWLAEVMQVGLLQGSRDLTTADPFPSELPVVKQGGGSGLTGGVITKLDSVDGHPTLFIKPNPNPAQAGPLYFSQFNDRGAVVVDKIKQVVGVLYDELEVTDASGTSFYGLAVPIAEVLRDLGTQTAAAMDVPDALEIDNVRTATATAAARVAEHETPLVAEPAVPAPDAVAPLEIPAAWHAHHDEVRALIARNRKVAAMWRRHGGPELTQAIVRAFRVPAEAIPQTVGGVSLALSLERLSSVFCKYGSAELRASLARLRGVLPAVGGFHFAEVLASVREALAVPETTS